jgi:quercetin dioxygenase-like cupin family protein
MYTREQLTARHMPFSSLRYSTEAFVDYCLDECKPKFNYALVGPGVSQSESQPVSLREPHGFQVGGVRMPHGKVNPPHLHFTCEVFICTRGQWEVRWGFDPGFESAVISEGDIISVPTWIFRGFRNVGPDDGFLFTALGGDNTGGIIWAPEVLSAAREKGVLLTDHYRLVDLNRGESLGSGERPLDPMSEGERRLLRRWTREEMESRIVRSVSLQWSSLALLDHALPTGGAEIAPVVGFGMSEHRDILPPIVNPHGVSLEWIRLQPGVTVSRHRLQEKQVMLVVDGAVELEIEGADGPATFLLTGGQAGWDSYALPGGCWRSVKQFGQTPARALLMTAGDQRKRIEWDPTVVSSAAHFDQTHDASGYLARRSTILKAQA